MDEFITGGIHSKSKGMNSPFLFLMLAMGAFVSGSDKTKIKSTSKCVLWEELPLQQESILKSVRNGLLKRPQRNRQLKNAYGLIEECVLKGVRRVQKLNFKEFTHILAAIIHLEKNETVDVSKLSLKETSKHFKPMFQSPEHLSDFLLEFMKRQYPEDVERIQLLRPKMDQMAYEGKTIDFHSYPILKDKRGRHCFNPRYEEHTRMLISSIVSINSIIESLINS